MVGSTSSTDFPVTADALQSTHGGGSGDGIVVQLDPTPRRVRCASYLGGLGYDPIRAMTTARGGELLLVGETSSSGFPVTGGALQGRLAGPSDGFVVKLAVAPSSPQRASRTRPRPLRARSCRVPGADGKRAPRLGAGRSRAA